MIIGRFLALLLTLTPLAAQAGGYVLGGQSASPIVSIGPKGDQGARGADGCALQGTSGRPLNSAHKDCDWAIDWTAGSVWRKISGDWGAPLQIMPIVDAASRVAAAQAARDAAQAARDAASSSASSAAASATAASNSASGASTHAGAAATSASSASASATAAASSAATASSATAFTTPRTGAATRSWTAKMGDAVNVRDAGAACDGTTDDAAAIQRAIDWVSPTAGRVELPEGHCRVTAPVVVPDKVILAGKGYQASFIDCDFAGAVCVRGPKTVVGINEPRSFQGGLRDLTIADPHAAKTGSIGLRIANWTDAEIRNVYVSGFETGVETIGGALYTNLERVRVSPAAGGTGFRFNAGTRYLNCQHCTVSGGARGFHFKANSADWHNDGVLAHPAAESLVEGFVGYDFESYDAGHFVTAIILTHPRFDVGPTAGTIAFRTNAHTSDIVIVDPFILPGLEGLWISCRVTEKAGSESDEAELVCVGPPSKVRVPRKGDEFTILGGWDDEGPVDQGHFTVQKISLSGDPESGDVIRVHMRAADYVDKLKGHKSKHYDNKKVKEIVEDVARDCGLEAKVADEIGKIKIPYRLRWLQSHIDFLAELADEIGAVVKPAGGKLIVTKRGSGQSPSGKTLTPIEIKRGQVFGYDIEVEPRPEMGEIGAGWHDEKATKRKVHKHDTGRKGPIHTLPHLYRSEDEAKQAAAAQAYEMCDASGSGRFDCPGLPHAHAEARVTVSGFGAPIDGRWRAETITKTWDAQGGFTTSVEVRAGDDQKGESGDGAA